MTIYHQPILATEILEFFNLKENHIVADLTTGEGGHSSLIAPLIPKGQLFCLDRDQEILAKAQQRLQEFLNITYLNATYDLFTDICKQNKFPKMDAILIDMGVSMFHFKGADRGFSFDDNSLDMRLSHDHPISAEQVINTYSEEDLADIFYYYGEERYSRRYAREIVQNRPFYTAKELSEFLMKKIGRHGKTHPATKIFQGLRIYVNEELEIAENMLGSIVESLAPNGILCIMTFHSLEDRLVKRSFQEFARQSLGKILTPKPVVPSKEEISRNPASRSTKLRVFQKEAL